MTGLPLLAIYSILVPILIKILWQLNLEIFSGEKEPNASTIS